MGAAYIIDAVRTPPVTLRMGGMGIAAIIERV
jgi:hypothetical protein